ncbi:MAG TPA: nucleoside recognition domain-containing protein [Anaeromyxobacteraceae bacterium]|nr:nucleoside recognition domain-containing protein [Anaeromyxobacteraceae bacterium]
MSAIWVFLVAVSVAVAAATGRMAALTAAVAESAGRAVTLALGLVGVMTLWLGLMKVAEEAGLVTLLARAARPVLRRLFPEVPPEHPAMGAMVMNIAANMLGLGNAATPFGLKAMAALDEMNPRRGTATDAQALFCAINTASVQIIPASVIALRAAAGARQPADVIGPTLLATSCALLAAVAAAKVLGRLLPAPPATPGARSRLGEAGAVPQAPAPPPPPPGGSGA